MKKLILAVAAVAALGGCIAVPVHDAGYGGYYGPTVGIHVAPPPVVYYGHGHSYRRHHPRHYR